MVGAWRARAGLTVYLTLPLGRWNPKLSMNIAVLILLLSFGEKNERCQKHSTAKYYKVPKTYSFYHILINNFSV